MAEEKKIVPEPQKPNKAAAPEQLTLDKGSTPPAEKAVPAKAEVPTQKPSVENKAPITPEKKEPEKEPVNPVSPEKPKEQGSEGGRLLHRPERNWKAQGHGEKGGSASTGQKGGTGADSGKAPQGPSAQG